MTDAPRPRRGRRVVLLLYALVVAIAGLLGAILGAARPVGLDPRLFGVVALPPSPLGVAVYGMVSVGTVLGVVLLFVEYVSRRTGQ